MLSLNFLSNLLLAPDLKRGVILKKNFLFEKHFFLLHY